MGKILVKTKRWKETQNKGIKSKYEQIEAQLGGEKAEANYVIESSGIKAI